MSHHQATKGLILTIMSSILPSEIWILVFEDIQRPAHLLNVVLTCKLFHDLAIRPLHRNITWRSFHQFNTPFWSNPQGHIHLIPRTLTIGDVRGPANRLLINLHNFDKIATRVATFEMLNEITFDHASLPNPILFVLSSLPRLERIVIKNSVFSANHPLTHTLGALEVPPALSELTLWGCKDYSRFQGQALLRTLSAFLHTNLRVLRIDWNHAIARFLSPSLLNPNLSLAVGDTQALPRNLPTALETLEIRLPPTKAWSEGSMLWSLIDPLVSFLQFCTKLKQFSVVGHLPSTPVPLSSLPELRSYSGSISSVPSILGAGNVEHLHISDEDEALNSVISLFTSMAPVVPRLKKLQFCVLEWDIEILHAIVFLFPHLEELAVRYKQKYPSEDVLVSLGPEFFARLPCLQSVHLYNSLEPPKEFFGDREIWANGHRVFTRERSIRSVYKPELGPSAGRDTEIKEIIIPWRRYCPNLTEVRLVRDHVWRRGFDGDPWAKRPVEIVDSLPLDADLHTPPEFFTT